LSYYYFSPSNPTWIAWCKNTCTCYPYVFAYSLFHFLSVTSDYYIQMKSNYVVVSNNLLFTQMEKKWKWKNEIKTKEILNNVHHRITGCGFFIYIINHVKDIIIIYTYVFFIFIIKIFKVIILLNKYIYIYFIFINNF